LIDNQEQYMTRGWRFHSITRALAGVLGVMLVAGAIVAVIAGFAAIEGQYWHTAAVSIVAIPALAVAQLFLIAAWTGDEPALVFDDSDSENLAR
jgi:hypothetical protein